MRILSTVLALVAVTGCKRQPASTRSCDQVGARFDVIARYQLAQQGSSIDPALRDGVAGLVVPMRDSMVRACREDNWAQSVRACFADASSDSVFRACERGLTGDQRRRLAQSAAGGIPAK